MSMNKKSLHQAYLLWWKEYRLKHKQELREYHRAYYKKRRLEIKLKAEQEKGEVKIKRK